MTSAVALDELEKAHRSMRVSIFNNTSRPMLRDRVVLHLGNFRVQPPEVIEGLSTCEFGSESSGMMAGTEAGCFYTMDGIQGLFEFGWNNPYFGKRGYKKVAPNGFDIECTAIDGTNCVVSFVVTETESAVQRSEAEIQQEKQKIDSHIMELDRIIKGMQKMLTMYAANKDAKNTKAVEDQIQAKQRDIESAHVRMHNLNLELEKKAKEQDPIYIQEELQKVKEKIEAAVKVRKGIELMKDMYSAGSQKDPRQAQIVEQQVESKRREIDALRKFEQKLLDRLTKAKPKEEHVVTVPPEKVEGQEVAPSTTETAPVATTIKAKVLFDVVPSSETELALHVGDIITVLDRTGDEWWEGEIDGKRGYFPATYAEIIQSTAGESGKAEFAHLYPKATVVTEYTASAEGELTLAVGDVLTVYGWDDAYWWEGGKDGTVGFFPCHCVQWVEPEADSSINVNVSTSGDFYEDIGKKDEPTATQAESTPETSKDEPAQQTQPSDAVQASESTPISQESIQNQQETPQPSHSEPSQVEVNPDVKPEVKTEVNTEVTPEEKTEVKPEVQPEVKPEIQAEVKLEVQPEVSQIVAPVTEPTQTPEAQNIPTPAIKEPEPEPQPQVVAPKDSVPQQQPTLQEPTQPVRKTSQPPRPNPEITTTPIAERDSATPVTPSSQQAVPQPAIARSNSAAVPLRTAVTATQVGNPIRKSVSVTAPGAASGKPSARALPVPSQTSAQNFNSDGARSLREGIRQKTTEFSTVLENYTTNVLGQYLDTIAKLQDKVKELEALQAQTAKERDELKLALAERDSSEDTNVPKVANRRSFWEQTARSNK